MVASQLSPLCCSAISAPQGCFKSSSWIQQACCCAAAGLTLPFSISVPRCHLSCFFSRISKCAVAEFLASAITWNFLLFQGGRGGRVSSALESVWGGNGQVMIPNPRQRAYCFLILKYNSVCFHNNMVSILFDVRIYCYVLSGHPALQFGHHATCEHSMLLPSRCVDANNSWHGIPMRA